jgi:hypothetical protein
VSEVSRKLQNNRYNRFDWAPFAGYCFFTSSLQRTLPRRTPSPLGFLETANPSKGGDAKPWAYDDPSRIATGCQVAEGIRHKLDIARPRAPHHKVREADEISNWHRNKE